MSETCKTCAHWQADDDYREGVVGRRCARIRHSRSIEGEATDTLRQGDWDWDMYEAAETAALTKAQAFCVDGSGYHAALYTAPDFGCILHEPTPSKGEPS